MASNFPLCSTRDPVMNMLFFSHIQALCHGSHTHTHPFNGPFSGTTRVSRYQKRKPIWILLKQETVSGSGISCAICKSASHSRQITMPVPHHSSFLQAGCPCCHPNNSVKALKAHLCHGPLTIKFISKFFSNPKDQTAAESNNWQVETAVKSRLTTDHVLPLLSIFSNVQETCIWSSRSNAAPTGVASSKSRMFRHSGARLS